jgi:eukaryotic-like serine/threonine-protein kinase
VSHEVTSFPDHPSSMGFVTVHDRSGRGELRSTVELTTLLQRRLHFLSLWALAFWALFFLLMVAAYSRLIVARPMGLVTASPLLGFGPVLLVSFAIVARATRPGVNPQLPRLRSLEWVLFGPTCLWSAAIWALFLHAAIITGVRTPMMVLAAASASFWITAMFAYGVLIPNDWRRCARAMVVFVLLAMIPDIVALVAADASGGAFAMFATTKLVTLAGVATVAIYGAHRIDVLEAGVREARELGQYTLHERIGGGGMGEVYRASHRLLRRPCAVKLIRPDLEGAEEHLARFEREVQETAALTHPNTVAVYDYGRSDDGTFYYVMEYLPGKSLQDLVESGGRLPPARVAHLLAQACEALHEAHLRGLVHRDIKPGNIIVTERGGVADVVKVVDFGLVAPLAPSGDVRLTQVGQLLGTPAYMSPEQCGGGEVGPASDIYSIGVVAWFCLTGAPLFAGRNPMQMLAAHLTEDPPPLAIADVHASAAVEEVVRRCLAKSPGDRHASAALLAEAWRGVRAVVPEERPAALAT